jgi:hypothetical protein
MVNVLWQKKKEVFSTVSSEMHRTVIFINVLIYDYVYQHLTLDFTK